MLTIKKPVDGLAMLAVLLCAGCMNLDLTNTDSPDRARALAQPGDVEALISGTFRVNYNAMQAITQTHTLFPALGNEVLTTGNVDGGQFDATKGEPRSTFKNDPTATSLTDPTGGRILWVNQHSILSSANDGLARLDAGLKLTSGTGATAVDNSIRGRAFAKFIQGVAWGNLAMIYDRAILLDEKNPIPVNRDELRALVIGNLKPYAEVRARALKSLDDAIALGLGNTFSIPGAWFSAPTSATPAVSGAQLAQIASAYAARIIAYTPRNPAERASADWAKVLTYTTNTITSDYGPQLISGLLTAPFLGSLQATVGLRMHYGIVGPADVSGAYQQWVATPYSQRRRFDISTPDRRIMGPTPLSAGAYVRYRSDINGLVIGGLFEPHYSSYQWFKTQGVIISGQLVLISLAEVNLIRAEALARTGNTTGAATLVNLTRTRTQTIGTTSYPGLPAVTASGVAAGADCMPRTEVGACGTLLDALRYERMLESFGSDALRAYADNRGWGRLTPGTPLQLPVPGQELVILLADIYSFGGGSLFAAPVTWGP